MRRQALESDIIIVNHHLFFADLAVKQQAAGAPDAGILPEAAAVIFDEAHELEEVASSYFGLVRLQHPLRRAGPRHRRPAARQRRRRQDCPPSTQQLRDRARMFFCQPAHDGDGRQPFDDREEFLETSGDLYLVASALPSAASKPRWNAHRHRRSPGLRKRVARLRTELEFLLESNASNMVYWIERRTRFAA